MAVNGVPIPEHALRRWDIFSMMSSTEGHEVFMAEIENHIKRTPWASIDHMLMALEREEIFIPTFSTVVNIQSNG